MAHTAIGISILCFYVLDFALNALQASLRNLLLDLTPAEQLATGNAWHGRMIHAGSIVGYTLGIALRSAFVFFADLEVKVLKSLTSGAYYAHSARGSSAESVWSAWLSW